MSVPTPEAPTTPPADPTPVATDTTPTPAAGDPPKVDEPLGAPGLEALRKERERADAAEKAAREATARIKEFEDRDKSEAEKLADAKAAAEKAAADATRELLRYKIAAEKKVDPDLLAGDDEDAMRAHADRLLAWRGDPAPSAPKPDPSQGGRPDGTPDIEMQIKDAQAKGDWRTVLSLQNQKLIAQAKTTT